MFSVKSLKVTLVFFTLYTLLISTNLLLAQQESSTEESIFSGVRDELAKARNQQVDILSPKNFGKASDEYNLAYEKFKKGGELKEIKSRLEKVKTYLTEAYKIAEVARVPFATVLQAREKALKANAPEFAPDLYDLAKKSFEEAALRIEAGDLNGAREKG